MIDLTFIIPYTNALYSTAPEFCPSYDEFRDMFSSGQLKSKLWVLDELSKIDSEFSNKSFVIAGSWFGTLGMMLKQKFPTILVNMIDIDQRCTSFVNSMTYYDNSIGATTSDMFEYRYIEDVIVNTSCEHINNIGQWINLLPKDRLIVLQSNNYESCADHINCVSSKEDFINKTGLEKVIFSGELVMPMYTRYMIIGRT